jgi:hypothetical protein
MFIEPWKIYGSFERHSVGFRGRLRRNTDVVMLGKHLEIELSSKVAKQRVRLHLGRVRRVDIPEPELQENLGVIGEQ